MMTLSTTYHIPDVGQDSQARESHYPICTAVWAEGSVFSSALSVCQVLVRFCTCLVRLVPSAAVRPP